MSYPFYKVVHVIGVMLLFIALGGAAFQWFVMHPFAKLHRKRCGCGGKKEEDKVLIKKKEDKK